MKRLKDDDTLKKIVFEEASNFSSSARSTTAWKIVEELKRSDWGARGFQKLKRHERRYVMNN